MMILELKYDSPSVNSWVMDGSLLIIMRFVD